MGRTFLSLLIAFAGYSLLNIAQACQKIGLGIAKIKAFKGWSIWIAATAATAGSSFIILYAVSIGNVSYVGAMAGTGLATLTLFSWAVMRERITRQELLGTGLVLGAAVIIGVFSQEPSSFKVNLLALFAFLGGILAAGISAILILTRRDKVGGITIGTFAGALGGFIPLFQKISASETGKSISITRRIGLSSADSARGFKAALGQAGELFTNPYAITWILLSVASMIVLQFALKRDKAIRIIPTFSASIIVIPVLGGLLCFREPFHPLQWAGVALILAGVFLTTSKRESGEAT